MKNKGLIIGIGAGVVILVLLTIYFYEEEKKVPKIQTSSWDKTYEVDDKGPYGLYAFKDLLDRSNLAHEVIMIKNQELSIILEQEDPNEHDLYIFIGNRQYLSDRDLKAINIFVAKGNSALCVNSESEFTLFTQLNIGYSRALDSLTPFANLWLNKDFLGASYRLPYIYKNDTVGNYWSYFEINEDYDEYEVLGKIQGEHNVFFQIDHVDGYFYYHSLPYFFTNISILNDEEGLEYAEDVISFLPDGNIYWDERSKNPPSHQRVTSPLQFILNNPPLLWAYLIFIGSLILYLVFNSRRKQRIIKGKEVNENQSLSFINTISQIYRSSNRPDKLFELKRKTFTAYINKKYYFNFSKITLDNAKIIAEKSEIPIEKIEEIVLFFEEKLKIPSRVTNEDIIAINTKIEYFYKNAR